MTINRSRLRDFLLPGIALNPWEELRASGQRGLMRVELFIAAIYGIVTVAVLAADMAASSSSYAPWPIILWFFPAAISGLLCVVFLSIAWRRWRRRGKWHL